MRSAGTGNFQFFKKHRRPRRALYRNARERFWFHVAANETPSTILFREHGFCAPVDCAVCIFSIITVLLNEQEALKIDHLQCKHRSTRIFLRHRWWEVDNSSSDILPSPNVLILRNRILSAQCFLTDTYYPVRRLRTLTTGSYTFFYLQTLPLKTPQIFSRTQ